MTTNLESVENAGTFGYLAQQVAFANTTVTLQVRGAAERITCEADIHGLVSRTSEREVRAAIEAATQQLDLLNGRRVSQTWANQ